MNETALLFGVGLLTGVVSPLLGIGGGMLMIPLLALVLGYPMETAVGLATIGIVAGSLAASPQNLKLGLLDPLLATRFGIPAALAGYAGGYAGLRVSGPWLQMIFSLTLQAVLIFLAFRRFHPQLQQLAKPTDIGPRQQAILFAAVFTASFLGSMVGIAGGSVVVPLLFILSPLKWKEAVACSTTMFAYSALPAAFLRLSAGHVSLPMALTVILGIQLGARLYRPIQHAIPATVSQLLFILVIGSSAASTFVTSLRGIL